MFQEKFQYNIQFEYFEYINSVLLRIPMNN